MFREYQSTKKDIDRVVMADWKRAKNCTGLFVAKIWNDYDLSYAVYGYNCDTRVGVRVTDYYSNEKSLICDYPESMFMIWRSFYTNK